MRKIFNKIAAILTTSSLVLPLTACVFNFYVNSATKTVMQSFANQTSSVLKALVMSKEKNADTSQTIQDILTEFPNPSIKNQTQDMALTSWNQFQEYWGFNKNINITGFNPAEEGYFLASGQGALTTQVNNYKNVNNVLSQANLISGLNVINNQILYNLIKGGDIKNTILDFLNQTKVTDPNQASTVIKLLKNIVVGTDWANPNQQAFTDYIVNPLTSLLNYLVEGLWTPNQATPTDAASFNTFMTNWRDTTDTSNFPSGQPYSQWNDGTNWTLNESYYQDWNQTDFNFYRGGTLINYLFYKISKDYQIGKPNTDYTKPRYLGDIITEHISTVDINGLIADLSQYFPFLLENPLYIMMLVEAIVPIIKEWGLGMSNIAQGAQKLTFGNIYPTDDANNSYNALDILNNIKYLLDNPGDPDHSEPGTLIYIIKSLIGMQGQGTIGNSFTYDVKVNFFGGDKPLGELINMLASVIKPLLEQIINLIKDNNIADTFANILNIYQKWVNQYDEQNNGIILDLRKLQDFLLNDTTGLITVINNQTIGTLYEIMTNPEPITNDDDTQYFKFYQSLGGQLPLNDTEPAPENFATNSVLDILQKNISNTNEPLGQIMLILLGNSSNNNNGIFAFIVESNNQWIKDNYTTFFDVTNKSEGRIYDAVMSTTTKNNIISTTLTYNFIYTIKNGNGNTVRYSFKVKVKSLDDRDSFKGTRNFYFTDIHLKSRK